MHCRWATVKFRERIPSCDAALSAQCDFNSYIVENSHLSGGAEIDALRHSHRHVTDAIKPDGHFRHSKNRLLFPSRPCRRGNK